MVDATTWAAWLGAATGVFASIHALWEIRRNSKSLRLDVPHLQLTKRKTAKQNDEHTLWYWRLHCRIHNSSNRPTSIGRVYITVKTPHHGKLHFQGYVDKLTHVKADGDTDFTCSGYIKDGGLDMREFRAVEKLSTDKMAYATDFTISVELETTHGNVRARDVIHGGSILFPEIDFFADS